MSLALGGVLLLAASLAAAPAQAAPAQSSPGERKVEIFGEDAPQGFTEVPAEIGTPGKNRAAAPSATVTPIEVNGPSDKRIDLVYLGDGYTEAEQDRYAAQVATSWNLLAAREPFKSYRKLFNVWQVNVVSAESGSDNDPAEGVVKDTALNSTYFCEGLARLICLDIPTAESYAALAPAFDQIAVVINSDTYGGAGYIEEDLVTFSGGHVSGPEILPHELGHSLGDLADEYPYWAYPGDGSVYPGEEPAEVNVSVHDAAQQTATRTKWWRWLGAETPDGGAIGTFEGANYYERGIYRPSDNSLMRTLRKPFNSVGQEEMTRKFYESTGLIDSVTPPSGAPVAAPARLTVTHVGIPTVSTRWYVNGHEITEWAGATSVDVLAKKPKGHGEEAPWCGRKDLRDKRGCTYTVTVTDSTAFVRDPAYREGALTSSITWRVSDKHGHGA
ncbi:M64 family metallopeptidase [Nonomuraea sp. LP-02]|uniref:M64 family metallopeptidase n=1 Tax=Nonomuraea sp. LP-02 TaxID=3097960 RepID=UPI002E323E5A|nr:M64 family metallopeptidase [Nonomuraea sp. LP-02]MED7930708.1 M64 family metallopeptidase [Nonomuraea sp. LP-02]